MEEISDAALNDKKRARKDLTWKIVIATLGIGFLGYIVCESYAAIKTMERINTTPIKHSYNLQEDVNKEYENLNLNIRFSL